nr:ubiquitin carboxyl-terminal hydrolase 12 [Quercus suber]
MEFKSCNEFAITRTARHFRPTHFLLKIQSYSLLCETGVEKYESGVFEAWGHKWRLSLYPKGNKKMNGTDHISLYLSIVDTEKYSLGWEVYATFKLFVFDQIRDKFLTIPDAEGTIRRFHDIKMEWGFDKFLPLDSFNFLPNGYLVNDCCVVGAEVFVHEHLKIFAEFKLRIRDQLHNKHAEEKTKYWFSAAFSDWGFSQLLLREDLLRACKGFLVEDTLIVEAEIMVMSTSK